MLTRRRWKRVEVDFRVRVSWELDGEVQREIVRATSLSRGGIGIVCPDGLPTDNLIKLEFTLPGSLYEFQLMGTVRQGQGFHYGLEFVDLRATDIFALAHFCDNFTAAP